MSNPTQGKSQIVDTTSKVSNPKKKKFTNTKPKRERQFKTKTLKLTNKKLQFVDILQIQHSNGKNESYINVVKEIDMNDIHPEHYRVIKTLVTLTNGFLHGKQLDNKSPEMVSLNQLIEHSISMLTKAREKKAKETPEADILENKDIWTSENVDKSTTLDQASEPSEGVVTDTLTELARG